MDLYDLFATNLLLLICFQKGIFFAFFVVIARTVMLFIDLYDNNFWFRDTGFGIQQISMAN